MSRLGLPDAPNPSAWRAALVVAPVDATAYTLAVGVGWLFADHTAHFLTVGPFLLGVAAMLGLAAPVRRRVARSLRVHLRGDRSNSLGELLASVRTGPTGRLWGRETALVFLAMLCWLALVTLVGGISTVDRYLLYTNEAPDPMHPATVMVAVTLLALPAGAFAAAVDDLALANARPRTLLAVPTAAPRATLKRSLLRGTRGGLSLVAVLLVVVGFAELELGVAVAPFLFLSFLVVAVAFRGIAFGSSDASSATVDVSPVRMFALLFALLLVFAPLAGVAFVRVDDTGYSDAERRPLPADAGEAVAAATANTRARSYRRTTVGRIHREGNWSTARRTRAVDRQDRQYRVVPENRDMAIRTFFGEGVLAGKRAGVSSDGPLEWRHEGWAADTGSPGAFIFEVTPPTTLNLDAPWRVIRENETALVLGIDGPAVGNATREVPRAAQYRVQENTSIRVVVDRRRGVLRTVRIRARFDAVAADDKTEWVTRRVTRRYENVGRHDVHRPEALGADHPLEWVWDLLYY